MLQMLLPSALELQKLLMGYHVRPPRATGTETRALVGVEREALIPFLGSTLLIPLLVHPPFSDLELGAAAAVEVATN